MDSFVYFYFEIENEMISLAFIVIFVFCLAIAVGSVLIGHQFINTYNTDFHKNYFYFLVSFYAFALYAIWGHILIRIMLVGLGTRTAVVEAVANFSSFLGLPFLILSWIMLINMAHTLFEKKAGQGWLYYHIGLFVLLLTGVGLGYDLLPKEGTMNGGSVKYIQIAYLSIFGLINFLVFLSIAKKFARSAKVLGMEKIQVFAMLMVLAFLLQAGSSVFAFHGKWQLALVILLFFISNLIPLLYIRYKSDDIFQPIKAENSSEETINLFIKKYHITKRECQIVSQICLGKTNQQIADELFISLQTVKDHTHRIYSKIGINSRMQLVQMVNK